LVNGLALRSIQLRVAIFGRNPNLRSNKHRIIHPALITLLHSLNDLAFHAKHRGGGVLLSCSDCAELAPRGPLLKLLPDVGIRCFTHAAIERRFQKLAPIEHGGTLEEMIAGIGHGLLRGDCASIQRGFVNVMLAALPRLGHNAVGLVSVLRGKVPMPL